MQLRRLVALVATFAFLLMHAPAPVGADTANKTFYRIKGSVGYANDKCDASSFAPIAAAIVLKDELSGNTKSDGQAAIILPDSSEVDLGNNTCVKMAAFNAVGENTVTLQQGAMKFRVVHPKGGKSNYKFQTVTSQVGVRGTVGLMATGAQGDTIACVQCDPGDVEVTVLKTGQKIPLLTGQALTISIAGIVAAVTTAAVLAGTAGAGAGASAGAAGAGAGSAGAAGGAGTFASVPAAASAGSAVGAAAGAAAAAGAVAGTTAAVAAGVVAAGAAVAASNSNTNNATPLPLPQGTPTGVPFIFQDSKRLIQVKPTPSPSPSPTPSAVTKKGAH